jgi:hypothetical protein
MNRINRRVYLSGALLALTFGGAAPSQGVARSPATPSNAGRELLAGENARVHLAYEALRYAECFEDTYVGYAGQLSHYVEAFRIVHSQPEAAALFHGLYEDSTIAGKLYALSGLYFANPALFADELEHLRKRRGRESVCTMHGCIGMDERVADVLRSKSKNRIRIARGQTVKDWFAAAVRAGHDSGEGDIAGGYTPLSFLDDDSKAPRDPL